MCKAIYLYILIVDSETSLGKLIMALHW